MLNNRWLLIFLYPISDEDDYDDEDIDESEQDDEDTWNSLSTAAHAKIAKETTTASGNMPKATAQPADAIKFSRKWENYCNCNCTLYSICFRNQITAADGRRSTPSAVDPYFTHFDPRAEHQSYKVKMSVRWWAVDYKSFRLKFGRKLNNVLRRHIVRKWHVSWRTGAIWKKSIKTCVWLIQRLHKVSSKEWPPVSRWANGRRFLFRLIDMVASKRTRNQNNAKTCILCS